MDSEGCDDGPLDEKGDEGFEALSDRGDIRRTESEREADSVVEI